MAGHNTGTNRIVDSHLTVDQNIGDAHRILPWIVVGGRVDDGIGIEDNDIGKVTSLEATAFADAVALSRVFGHALDH